MKKRLTALFLSLTTVVMSSSFAMASDVAPILEYNTSTGEITGGANSTTVGPNITTEGSYIKNGHTTFSVMESDYSNVDNFSFTIPLYVTMVAGSDGSVALPTGYGVYNSNINEDAYSVAVTGINVTVFGAQGNDWELNTSEQAPEGKNYLNMNLGYINIGNVEKGHTTDLNLKSANSVFWNESTNNYQEIAPNTTLSIPLTATASLNSTASESGENKAIPAFKIEYTISPFDKELGQLIGTPYMGDSQEEAGL